ncbi:MAG: redoxin domain-containing protein [Bacteroidetes bacterium]|nr:redoxin domain-containing protein [Bacteroidota bacterium]
MNSSFRFFSLLILAFLCVPAIMNAQGGPVAGSTYTINYVPPPDSPLAEAEDLTLIYVFDFWNVRYGTRLALWQNVLRPDTARVRFAPLTQQGRSWTVDIHIPETAGLLSYIVSNGDGTLIDGNDEKTYTVYVVDEDGKPMPNARFYNIPFLHLAQAELGRIVREAEQEITDYPENFVAYHQYFKLLLEQGKGSARIQQRIATRIEEMEKRYGANMEFRNMAAETWYYILQDVKRGLSIRNTIPPAQQWPQVLRMFDRQGKEDEQKQRKHLAEQRRNALRNTELPSFNLHDRENNKVAFPVSDGKTIAFVFFASSSENSHHALRQLADMLPSLSAANMEIIAVSVDPDKQQSIDYFTKAGFPFTLLFNQGAVLQLMGVDSIPITYIVDGENIVREILVGYAPNFGEAMKAALEAL